MTPTSHAPARKRQWGAERRSTPLPTIHARPSDRTITLGRLAIVVTVVAWVAYLISTIIREVMEHGGGSFRFTMEAIFYLVVVTFLTFSALMYLVARQGALQRFRAHVRVPRAELDRHFSEARLIDHGAGALVPRGGSRRAVHAVVGGAAGVPLDAHRASRGRPTSPHGSDRARSVISVTSLPPPKSTPH